MEIILVLVNVGMGAEGFEHLDRDLSPINRGRHIFVQISQRAHLVVVAVKNEISFHPVFVGFEIIKVRNHIVDARHSLVRILNAASDDEDIAINLDDGAVFAILIETTQSENFDHITHCLILQSH